MQNMLKHAINSLDDVRTDIEKIGEIFKLLFSLLEEDTIFTFQTLRHLVRLRIQGLVTLTAYQQAMLTTALSRRRSLLALTISAQLKWKFSISLRRNVRKL